MWQKYGGWIVSTESRSSKTKLETCSPDSIWWCPGLRQEQQNGLKRCLGEKQYSKTDKILRGRQRRICSITKFLMWLTRVSDRWCCQMNRKCKWINETSSVLGTLNLRYIQVAISYVVEYKISLWVSRESSGLSV